MPEGSAVREMFARVAPRYDRANRLLSLGTDVRWRRRAVAAAAVQPGECALDVCSGTGDLAFALQRAGARVAGSDFCRPMLQLARRKERAGTTRFLQADTLALPFADGSFDLCTVAFGIRNVSDPESGLREMARVVRPGGRVVVLEFCRPRTPVLGPAYLFYFRRILPHLGRWISGDREGAYGYLPESVMHFPEREQFTAMMERAGLERPRTTLLTCGIAAIYRGEVRG